MKKIKVFCKNLSHFHHQMLRPPVVVIQVARCRVRTGVLLQSLEAGRAHHRVHDKGEAVMSF